MLSGVKLKDGFIKRDDLFGPLPSTNDTFEAYLKQKAFELINRVELNERKILELSVNELKIDQNWMFKVSLACQTSEINMEILSDNKRVFFKAIRQIKPGEVLYVFPAKDVEISLGLPFVPVDLINKEYKCKKCNKNLNHQFCLMLHLKYFCKNEELQSRKRKNSNYIETYGKVPCTTQFSINSLYTNFFQSMLSRAALERNNLVLYQTQQNWCAKCNLNFRLTNDLVNHMRIHHKTNDEYKTVASHRTNSNKERKQLKCEICNEIFKERHHLARHMTSHR